MDRIAPYYVHIALAAAGISALAAGAAVGSVRRVALAAPRRAGRLLRHTLLWLEIRHPWAWGGALAVLVYLLGAETALRLEQLLEAAPGALGWVWPPHFADPDIRAAGLSVLRVAPLFGLVVFLLLHMRHIVFDFGVETYEQWETPRRPAVVMALSALDGAQRDAVKAIIARQSDDLAGLAADPALSGSRHPWQQNLRALAHHFSSGRPVRPRAVVVVITPESEDDYALFEALLEGVFARSGLGKARIEAQGPVDAGSLAKLRRAYRESVGRLRTGPHPFQLADIAIDATSGTKLMSIAAAAATIGTPMLLTYVETAGAHAVCGFEVTPSLRAQSV